jgi:[ribosomal protein S5]-alanine N-acetyltransferase
MPSINFTPFPNLTTERLLLRQLSLADEAEMFALRADESVAKFVDRPVAQEIDQIRTFIQRINDGIAKNESVFWVLTLKNGNKLIGTICLWNISKVESKAEIGYELLPIYQGKGLMQEAVTAVLDYGFETMKLESIEGVVHPQNAPSIKLLERNKFVQTGTLEENDVEMVIYALKKNRP